jgi:hypothetical protein
VDYCRPDAVIVVPHFGHARQLEVVCAKILLTREPHRLELEAAVQLELEEFARQGLEGLVG